MCSCRFNLYPLMSFSRWVVTIRFDSCDDVVWSPSAPQSWHVVHVHFSMLLFFFHFCFNNCLRRVVCPLRGLLRCLMCAFVLVFPFEQIDVLFCSMKFRCVIAGAFGVGVFWMHSVATECCVMYRVLCSLGARVRRFVCNQ